MQAFDASSMVYAWDNYPIRQFPGLWEWMAAQIMKKVLVMPDVALEEVSIEAPECGQWLKENNIEKLDINNLIMQNSMRIKCLLGIVGDSYHPKGVGENDILIIATARAHGAELISDEGKQNQLPDKMAKRKIPAVCDMAEVSVPCINFVEYIKRSDAIFG